MPKTLHIIVSNKVATYSQRGGDIVCGNNDYEIQFKFDTEWADHITKTARFIYNGDYVDVVFSGDTVAVPLLKNTTSVAVGVFSGNLKTTTPALIGCKKSILCEDGSPVEPTPDVYAQIIDLLNEPSECLYLMDDGDGNVIVSGKLYEMVDNEARAEIAELKEQMAGANISEIEADIETMQDQIVDLKEQDTATTLPSDGIAKVGVMYFLGEITSLSAGFPATAERGDMVYLSFSTGATAPTVNVTTTNFIGIDTQIQANCYYEIMGVWDGSRWVCVVHEVSL